MDWFLYSTLLLYLTSQSTLYNLSHSSIYTHSCKYFFCFLYEMLSVEHSYFRQTHQRATWDLYLALQTGAASYVQFSFMYLMPNHNNVTLFIVPYNNREKTKHLGTVRGEKLSFNRKKPPVELGSLRAAISHDQLGVRRRRHDKRHCGKMTFL